MSKNKYQKILTDYNPSYRWHNLANAYLELADIGLSHLKLKKNFKTLLPIIYCIKHGLELYLKGLNVELDYSFLKVHNQKELCNKIYRLLSFSEENISENKKVLSDFISIVWSYHTNLIGGQRIFESTDEMNEKFRYLQKESYGYSKLRHVNIDQVKKDIKNIKIYGSLLNIKVQVNKEQLNGAIYFDSKFDVDKFGVW